jgi:hypothetical protein
MPHGQGLHFSEKQAQVLGTLRYCKEKKLFVHRTQNYENKSLNEQ